MRFLSNSQCPYDYLRWKFILFIIERIRFNRFLIIYIEFLGGLIFKILKIAREISVMELVLCKVPGCGFATVLKNLTPNLGVLTSIIRYFRTAKGF